MRFLNALVPTAAAWVKRGADFSGNLFRRRVIRKRTIRTMKYILKRVKPGCSASCGFR